MGGVRAKWAGDIPRSALPKDRRSLVADTVKIVTVIPSLAGGGAERVLSLLSREWNETHEVILIVFNATRPAYTYSGRLIDLRLELSGRGLHKLQVVVASLVAVTRLLVRERPDWIVSFMEPANFPTAIAASLAGLRRRAVVSVHHDPLALPRMRQLLMRWIYLLPNHVVSVSQGVKMALCAIGVKSTKISVIPNPVDIRSGMALRPRPLDERYVLGAGRFRPEKGFDRLLKAFALLDRQDLRLVILGDGVEPERIRLWRLANALGIDSNLQLPGFVSDVDRWYQNAECFVLSSRSEAWGMVLLEAMVNGCPVISFDCPYGPSEIVEDGHSGLLVTDGDIYGLANAIGSVLNDRKLRLRLINGGGARVRAFNTPDLAERWIRLAGGT